MVQKKSILKMKIQMPKQSWNHTSLPYQPVKRRSAIMTEIIMDFQNCQKFDNLSISFIYM